MDRRNRLRWLQDGALAVLLSAMAVLEVALPMGTFLGDGSLALSAACAAVITLALVLRRRRPLLTVAVIAGAWLPLHLAAPVVVLFWGQFVPLLVATYSVARHGVGRAPWIGAVCTATSLIVLDLTVPAMGQAGEIAFHWLMCTIAWLAGYGLRRFERRAHAAAQLVAETEASARERTLLALAEERTRIARELHDVVAHSVSVMVVQAGAAELVVDEDPARVRAALGTIRTTGQDALAEMRRVVTMLRTEDEHIGLEPQPGVASLVDLVDASRRAGLRAEFTIEGLPRALPAGLDLAVYRIAQESLTNVRRHARATRARITLQYSANRVDLTVEDDGVGPRDPSGGGAPDLSRRGGHGLIGMRERASLYGGHLEASSGSASGSGSGSGGSTPGPGPGFTVRASFPVGAS